MGGQIDGRPAEKCFHAERDTSPSVPLNNTTASDPFYGRDGPRVGFPTIFAAHVTKKKNKYVYIEKAYLTAGMRLQLLIG